MKNVVSKFKSLLNKNGNDLRDEPITKIDSKDLTIHTTAVENYDGVLSYVCSNVKRSIQLTTYLKDELTEIFGKHNTRFKGEFYYYVWIVEYDNEIFHIFTANGKGTQFSIAAKLGDDKSKVCINFLKKMESLLVEL